MEYEMYLRYRDLDVVRRDYSHMAAYVDHIAAGGPIYAGVTFGDWVSPTNGVPPSSQLLGSMFIYREAKDLATMAAAIGNTAGASKYDKLAASIDDAVNAKFYDAAKHEYRDPPGTQSQAVGGPYGVTPLCAAITGGTTRPCIGYSQTANAVALAFGLAPDADRKAIADGLAADAVAKGDHLSTGAAGSQYLLPMLSEGGHSDEGYKVAANPTAPGWGQWFQQCHATTMWESWEDDTCSTARSRDHAFMGAIDDWFYGHVAGIQPTAPGFATVQIKPYLGGGLNSASAHESSPLGRVSSAWTRSGTRFKLSVHIPVGARATVFVPATGAAAVSESGRPVARAGGVKV